MKVKAIKINSFRGIPNEINLNFTDKSGNPVSVLIFGDNGSGKSSIIDAIEYNLQGKIEKSDSLNNEFRPYPISLIKKLQEGAKTEIIFENDESFARDIIVHNDESGKIVLEKSAYQLHPYYRVAPIALRRNDITNYSTIPIQRKQLMFWSFLYNTFELPNEQSPQILDKAAIQILETERMGLKKTRKEKLTILAQCLNIPEETIPFGIREDFMQFVKQKIRKGLTSKQIKILRSKGSLNGINDQAYKLALEIERTTSNIKRVQAEISKLKKIDDPSSEIRKEQIREFLRSASKNLSDSFKKISTVDFVNEIELRIGALTDVSFEIILVLKNGREIAPEKVFSEANLDLLILLLFTSFIRASAEQGQSKLIVLDDVLQSVDATIRLNFVDYLMTEFKDWQIIITAHDRLWLNQLSSSFKRHHHPFKRYDINWWDFDMGLHISEFDSSTDINSIDIALNTNNIQLIATQTGIFFETICQKLSMSLHTSVRRQTDDRYTIGDLWSGIKKYFRRSMLFPLTEEIEQLLYIRNLLSAHYNEWALSMTNEEIFRFAKLVKEFYNKTFCEVCQTWVSSNDESSCQCSCKKLFIPLK